MVNKVTLIGWVGKKPDVRILDNGISLAKFHLSTTESYKDEFNEYQKVTTWHDIVAWKNLAVYIEQEVSIGDLVHIEGKITHEQRNNSKGERKVYTNIVVNQINILKKKF